MTSDVGWLVRWETELAAAEHQAIARLLSSSYPDRTTLFAGGRSWFSARPEVRLVGAIDGRVVAHVGVLRRFVRVPPDGTDVLVGDCGLVAVAPDVQGGGIGGELLRRTRRLLGELAVPFGQLTCQPHVVGFYERGGWHRIPEQRTVMLGRRGTPTVFDGPTMVLPVRASLASWPGGRVDRNGYEV